MAKAPKICFDRLPPQELRRPMPTRSMADGRTRAISPKGKQWVNGSTIRIRFLEGSDAQRDMVMQFAPEWTDHANLIFVFSEDPRAEIRVTFNSNDGAWSYVGLDNMNIPLDAPTLNLGWQDQGVILHEFGHMIGLGHEHQNPEGGIIWNEAAVIADLSGPPNYWDEATIRHNVLDKYSVDQVHGTEFDPESIMLYPFPDEWTQNMGSTQANDDLSELDKMFIRSEEMYPGRGTTPQETAVDLPVSQATVAAISEAGEEDLYRFVVENAGTFVVQTSGSTDVVMSLFGPDSTTNLVGEDDDGGTGTNARISAALQPGVFYARVRHYNPASRGEYRIQVAAL